jgi:hypothetical protein
MDKFKFIAELVLVEFLVIFLVEQTLQDFMCSYIDKKSDTLKGCLLAALESKEGYFCVLVESLGSPVNNEGRIYSELLANAGLFWEEERITRDGRNRYRLYHLTDAGSKIAKQIRDEGFDGEIAQTVPVI